MVWYSSDIESPPVSGSIHSGSTFTCAKGDYSGSDFGPPSDRNFTDNSEIGQILRYFSAKMRRLVFDRETVLIVLLRFSRGSGTIHCGLGAIRARITRPPLPIVAKDCSQFGLNSAVFMALVPDPRRHPARQTARYSRDEQLSAETSDPGRPGRGRAFRQQDPAGDGARRRRARELQAAFRRPHGLRHAAPEFPPHPS